MKKKIFVCAVILIFLLKGLWSTILPEPEHCALCGGNIRYHAPCLLDLSTGQMTEMAVYEPEPTQRGEIAKVQNLDTHVFCLGCGGQVGFAVSRTPQIQQCTALISDMAEAVDQTLFCRDCRRMLPRKGYALVDLYCREEPMAYDLTPGQTHIIRDYTVAIMEQAGEMMVTVSAELF